MKSRVIEVPAFFILIGDQYMQAQVYHSAHRNDAPGGWCGHVYDPHTQRRYEIRGLADPWAIADALASMVTR